MIQKNKIHKIDKINIRWDAHSCPPFEIGADLSFLQRYKNAGVDYVSLNVGFDLIAQTETLNIIDYFSRWVKKHHGQYCLIKSVKDIYDAKTDNKLGVGFDIEGSNVLNDSLDMVSYFYELGVRQMLFAYNKNNSSGGGCLDEDAGLTIFGKQLVRKLNNVGMVIDCSHVGFKSSMEIMELSEYPVVFSHSNPSRVANHFRNISDEQIYACARTGGVIGINGIGIFLGNNDVSSARIIEHIDYVVQKVGPDHVGIGMDCVFAPDEIKGYVENNPESFPVMDNVCIAKPEQFIEICDLLELRGYTESSINKILGENFLRVAKTVWK